MRRVLGAALLGLMLAPAALEAGGRQAYNFHSYFTAAPGWRGYGAPTGGIPPGYSSYGRRLRGGYGRNGFAPLAGPQWGPDSYLPAAGTAPYGQYHSIHHPGMAPPVAYEEQLQLEQPQQVLESVDAPAAPKLPPVAPALK